MSNSYLNWTEGLDRSGWIATGLFVIFFVIAILTIFMMLKLRNEEKKHPQNKTPDDIPPDPPRRTRPTPAPEPEKTEANPVVEEDSSDPIEQAQIYITYGLNKQAEDLLEKYLKVNPSDENAREMLSKAQSSD